MTINDTRVYYGPAHFNSAHDIDGFIKVFREAFAGAPYFEEYTVDQARAIWDEHFQHGRIILAKDGSEIVGLGCSVPLYKAPQAVQEFLADMKKKGYLPNDFTPNSAWYMSELAVLEKYRNRGIAYELVRHRLIDVSHGSSAYYVMRTDSKESNSMHLYLRVGADVLPEVQDVSDSEQVTENGSESTTRIYLYGRSVDALHFLTGHLGKTQEEGPSDEPETSPAPGNNKENAA